LDPKNNSTFIGVSSSDKPRFRHLYNEASKAHPVQKAGFISFNDNSNDQEERISAFAPIKDSKGNTTLYVVATSDFSAINNLLLGKKIKCL